MRDATLRCVSAKLDKQRVAAHFRGAFGELAKRHHKKTVVWNCSEGTRRDEGQDIIR